MTESFPTDVYLRLFGDEEAARQLIPLGRTMLFRALAQQQTKGVRDVNLLLPIPGYGSVRAILSGDIKQILLTANPPVSRPVEETKSPVIETRFPQLFEMYSGLVRPTAPEIKPQVHLIPNPIPRVSTDVDYQDVVLALDQFHPDEVCAGAYGLELDWQMPTKLAVNVAGNHASGDAQSNYPKPGQYSGAMKRVVQALYGIGVETATAEYISEELPATDPDIFVHNSYDFTFIRTHGIHKGRDGSIWLVEINRDEGVMAMPLPLFEGSESPEYESLLAAYGDTDTLNVVFEFGGLPTGEAFPTGSALSDAIQAGKVVKLLTAADISHLYYNVDSDVPARVTNTIYPTCGWAFSESGREAANVIWCVQNFAAYEADPGVWAIDGWGTSDIKNRAMTMRHWKMVIDIIFNPDPQTPTDPVGVGSVQLELVEETYAINTSTGSNIFVDVVEFQACEFLRVPAGNSEMLVGQRVASRPRTGVGTDDAVIAEHPTCPLMVFYVGETPEVLRGVNIRGGSALFGSMYFYGDSLDIGIAKYPNLTSPGLGGVIGAIIPAYCREGYVLLDADMTGYIVLTPSDLYPTFPIHFKGYFAQLGQINFTTMTEIFGTNGDDPLPFGPSGLVYVTYTWVGRWSHNSGSNYEAYNFRMAVVINAGPIPHYIMNDGPGVPPNTLGGFVFDDPDQGTRFETQVVRPEHYLIKRSDSLAVFEVPDDVKPYTTTFVGQPT